MSKLNVDMGWDDVDEVLEGRQQELGIVDIELIKQD